MTGTVRVKTKPKIQNIPIFMEFATQLSKKIFQGILNIRLYFLVTVKISQLPIQCYSHEQGNLGNLGGSKVIQAAHRFDLDTTYKLIKKYLDYETLENFNLEIILTIID